MCSHDATVYVYEDGAVTTVDFIGVVVEVVVTFDSSCQEFKTMDRDL